MKTTNRLFCLFAAILTTATLMAEVVYEPLVVDSGFNRDIILAQGGDTAISYLKDATYWTFATESVIAANCIEHDKYTNDTATFNRIKRSGWPDDYRVAIRCTNDGDAINDPLYRDVYWQLAPYTGPNALCIRPDYPSIGGVGTIKFKKVGSYERIFFLLATARDGSSPKKREVIAKLYYTDGEMVQDTFAFGGLSGATGHNVRLINILENGGYYEKNKDASKLNAFATVFHLDVEKDKLIHRIEFQNEQDFTSVIILGVTGVTADAEVPDAEAATVSNIQENTFEACWEAIQDAASYRLDVAEDPDFQRILEDYNNLPVSGSTCQEVAGLTANNDYYWRVRSVNADGGQSASSAVRRVRTAGDNPPATSETDTDIETMLSGYAGYRGVVPAINIHRTLYRDGAFNTICLPFNMSAEEIAASQLTGAYIYEFVEGNNDNNQLDIVVSPTDHIAAGVPYLIKWAPTSPEIINNGELTFYNVNIVTSTGQTIGGANEVRFVGNIGIAEMVEGDHNNLFLGAANTLYWPEGENRLKGFRAYFQIPTTGSNAVAKRTPARLVMQQDVTTDVISIQPSAVSIQKALQNGQIVILRDGKRYNILGVEL